MGSSYDLVNGKFEELWSCYFCHFHFLKSLLLMSRKSEGFQISNFSVVGGFWEVEFRYLYFILGLLRKVQDDLSHGQKIEESTDKSCYSFCSDMRVIRWRMEKEMRSTFSSKLLNALRYHALQKGLYNEVILALLFCLVKAMDLKELFE